MWQQPWQYIETKINIFKGRLLCQYSMTDLNQTYMYHVPLALVFRRYQRENQKCLSKTDKTMTKEKNNKKCNNFSQKSTQKTKDWTSKIPKTRVYPGAEKGSKIKLSQDRFINEVKIYWVFAIYINTLNIRKGMKTVGYNLFVSVNWCRFIISILKFAQLICNFRIKLHV